MVLTWTLLHFVSPSQIHGRRTIRPEQESPPASTLVIVRPRAFLKSALLFYNRFPICPSSLDSSPLRNGLTWSVPNSKGREKANFLGSDVFIIFPSLCLTALPMLIACVSYVCMKTSAVFLFKHLKIFEASWDVLPQFWRWCEWRSANTESIHWKTVDNTDYELSGLSW